MTQRSSTWTDGAGDGGPLTQAQARFTTDDLEQFPDLRLPWRPLAGAKDPDDGVFRGQLDEYQASPVALDSRVHIASGRGICDDTIHESTSPVELTPTPPTLGLTGGVVVLQKSWEFRTVRLALHQSSDGVALPPALTQQPGVLWEIPLWDYTVTTGGVVVVTFDRRRYLGSLDLEASLRGFYEGGRYASSRLGAWAGTTAPVSGAKAGVGWEVVLGTGASVSAAPAASPLPGAWRFQTGGANNIDAGLTGPQQVGLTQEWTGIFVAVPPGMGATFIAGLQATNQQFADANNQIGFRAVNGGNIFAYVDVAGIETVIDSGKTANGTDKHVLVMTAGATAAEFWVDGQRLGSLVTSALASTALYGQIGVRSTAAANAVLYVGEALMFARA